MLNIEDAYLTEQEIEVIRDGDVWGLRDELMQRTAKAATEKALRWAVEWAGGECGATAEGWPSCGTILERLLDAAKENSNINA